MNVVDLVIYAILTLVGLAIGWSLRQSAAHKTEAALKRDVLDAKSAVPQMESSVRNRELQIANFEAQVESLKSKEFALTETIDQHKQQLISRDRELRNANSELKLLRDGNELDTELYGDESEQPKAGDADLVERVEKAESRYEAMKRGLIDRDDRITELEAELASGSSSAAVPSEQLEALQGTEAALKSDLESRDETIRQLKQRLDEEAERREVLESLAKRRSEAKLEQREKLATFEEELPQLKKDLAEKEAMIEQRVTTIASLREDVANLEIGKSAAESNIATLNASIAEQSQAITEHDSVMGTMSKTLEAHKTQIETLTQRNTRTDEALRTAEQTVLERDGAISAMKDATGDVQNTIDTLKNSVKDREFKIDDLSAELNRAREQLSTLREQRETAGSELDQRATRLETENRQVREREADLQLANSQLEARLEKLETTASENQRRDVDSSLAVAERDNKLAALDNKLLDAQGQIDMLAREKNQAEAALKNALDRVPAQFEATQAGKDGEHEQRIAAVENKLRDAQGQLDNLAREKADLAVQLQNAEAANNQPRVNEADTQLRETGQRVKSLENLLKDRDFRIDGLLQDVAGLQAKLDVYRNDDESGMPSDPVAPQRPASIVRTESSINEPVEGQGPPDPVDSAEGHGPPNPAEGHSPPDAAEGHSPPDAAEGHSPPKSAYRTGS